MNAHEIQQPVLVIGDIHHRTVETELLIERHSGRFKTVVFLGDYFDDFGDTPERMQSTCRWLLESMQQPNRVHLLGNHDLCYLNPDNNQLACPGWTATKQHVFDRECSDLPRDRFVLALRVSCWLLSHAGFHRALIGGLRPDELVCAANDALKTALCGHRSTFLDRGRCRGGDEPFGGITWLDWSEEFRPIEGIHQIVGHTPTRGIVRGRHLSSTFELIESAVEVGVHPAPGDDWLSANWCVDTQQRVGVLIDGEAAEISFETVAYHSSGRSRAITPDHKAMMHREPGSDLQDDLDDVRGDR